MKKDINFKNNFLSGITAAMLIGSYSLAVCSAVGFNMLSFAICAVICAFFSINNNNKIFAPHPFLLVPIFYILGEANQLTLLLSICFGAILFCILKKPLRKIRIPDYVLAGGGLALALSATVLLTNQYFGIGASGAESLEMLKSYRSLGFHPNFRGLLYGTVTLFAMITYPFKFKKLNKYLPAEFITLLIPLIMNLFLNPEAELTTINEISLTRLSFDGLEGIYYQKIDYSILFRGTLSTAILLFAYKSNGNNGDRLCRANAVSGALTGLPVKEYSIFRYNGISAVVCIIILIVSALLLPDIIARMPAHCIGAMLIVAAWQSVPYKSLGTAFRKNAVLSLIGIIAIAVSFILFGTFCGFLLCFIITFIEEKKDGRR